MAIEQSGATKTESEFQAVQGADVSGTRSEGREAVLSNEPRSRNPKAARVEQFGRSSCPYVSSGVSAVLSSQGPRPLDEVTSVAGMHAERESEWRLRSCRAPRSRGDGKRL